nr:hypothetical protein [Tanacetum cinerariifolium]
VDEGASAVPAPMQAPQSPALMVRPAKTMEQRLGRTDDASTSISQQDEQQLDP